MNRKNKSYLSTLAALLLVLCAVWNIKCESDISPLNEGTIEKQRQQVAFLQYIHENSRQYKQSLKQDTLFAQRLDSIDKERIDSIERQAKVTSISEQKRK